MKRLNRRTPGLISALALLGLAGGCQPDPVVPTKLNLYPSEPVLMAEFEATPTGYSMKAFRAAARPTLTPIKDRPVRIISEDGQGNTLWQIALDNPRVRYDADDGTNHVFETVNTSRFVVFFPEVMSIRQLTIRVDSGPNAVIQQSFPVVPSSLPFFTNALSQLSSNMVVF